MKMFLLKTDFKQTNMIAIKKNALMWPFAIIQDTVMMCLI